MSLRLATFNVENLMTRFDFSGYRNQLRQDRVIKLFEVRNEGVYQQLEQARVIAATDDTRQLTALAIADADADILCLQEVDNMAALQAFEYGYLFRMVGNGYKRKYLVEGNDSRGIDVAVPMREETRDGQRIELKDIRSHAALTYRDLDLFDDQIALTGRADDRIFKRDCLELDLMIGNVPFSLYVVHFKSMDGPRTNGLDGRQSTMPIRRAEARAVRRIIENRFGAGHTAKKNFAICGDMNDYQERVVVIGGRRSGYRFEHRREEESALDVFSRDGFAENVVARREALDRWTLYHARGPEEQHLCQLDYLWLSPALAAANAGRLPEIIRNGQPFRTVFPPGQEAERYPRTGWDRPKASDHCPVVMTLDLI
jgi:predicted extracellular nuclease